MPTKTRQSEAAFQLQVLALAYYAGWTLLYHAYDARRSPPGLPDLLLASPPRLLWLELKTAAGRLRPGKWSRNGDWLRGQEAVLELLGECGQEAHLIRDDEAGGVQLKRVLGVKEATDA